MRNRRLIIWLLVIAVIVLLGVSLLVSIYNQLSKVDREVNLRWTELQSELFKRYVLIPSITASVRSYTRAEETTLMGLEDAYAKFQKAKLVSSKVRAANLAEADLGKVLLTQEFYPVLKVDRTFVDSLSKLSLTEERANSLREGYNQAAQRYNRAVKQFPASLFAPLLGFESEKPLFEGVTEVKKAPKIKIKTLG